MFNGIEVITYTKIYDLTVSASFKTILHILNITVYKTIVTRSTAKYHESLIIFSQKKCIKW